MFRGLSHFSLSPSIVPLRHGFLQRSYCSRTALELLKEQMTEEEWEQLQEMRSSFEYMGISTIGKRNRVARVANKKIFKDNKIVHLRAGDGGNGCISFTREKHKREVPPDGGDGGNGGDIYFEAQERPPSLDHLASSIVAESGKPGMGRKMHGKSAPAVMVPVPKGTLIRQWDAETGNVGKELADLKESGERFLAVKGGKGGRGNAHFATGAHRSPKIREEGTLGQTLSVKLELRTIADVGLVGFPNAGKSSLLQRISKATPPVASYAFTTLHPFLGVVSVPVWESPITVADLPGLIDGSAENRGLGHRFLQHIERTSVLCYVLDLSAPTMGSPWKDFQTLRHELGEYNPQLLEKRFLIVANKMDITGAKRRLTTFSGKMAKEGLLPPIVAVSALTQLNIEDLKQTLLKIVKEERTARGEVTEVSAYL